MENDNLTEIYDLINWLKNEIIDLNSELRNMKKQIKNLEGYKNYDWFLKGK